MSVEGWDQLLFKGWKLIIAITYHRMRVIELKVATTGTFRTRPRFSALAFWVGARVTHRVRDRVSVRGARVEDWESYSSDGM